MGHASTAVDERIERLSTAGTGGNVITLNAPGTARTVLTIDNLSLGGGDAFFRSDTLGDLTRVVFTNPPPLADGIVPGVFVGPAASLSATSFGVYYTRASVGGILGLRALTAAEKTLTTLIQNPASGGTTPTTAHVELTAPATATGPANTIASLMIGADGSLT